MATKKIKLGDSSTWATMASLKDSKPCAASTTTAPTSTAAKGVIRYRPVPSLASPPRVLACTGAEEEDGMHDHRCRSRQEAGARRRAGNIRTVRRVTAHSAGETEGLRVAGRDAGAHTPAPGGASLVDKALRTREDPIRCL